MPRVPFKTLYCEKFKCAPDDYEERVFRRSLFWHARLLAPLLRTITPGFFVEDFKFIRYLGEALDARQAKVDVMDFKDTDRKNWRLLHTGLKIRVSHRKVRRLAFRLFAEAGQMDGQADTAAWRALK
ncbi:MAG TPA: hypothetical protein VK731_07500 [Candidatus Cybelea sp.]|jgi:hypothetical protein|nr:hypothetical protein [Candidatus Cybelea sp.]